MISVQLRADPIVGSWGGDGHPQLVPAAGQVPAAAGVANKVDVGEASARPAIRQRVSQITPTTSGIDWRSERPRSSDARAGSPNRYRTGAASLTIARPHRRAVMPELRWASEPPMAGSVEFERMRQDHSRCSLLSTPRWQSPVMSPASPRYRRYPWSNWRFPPSHLPRSTVAARHESRRMRPRLRRVTSPSDRPAPQSGRRVPSRGRFPRTRRHPRR